MINLSTLELFSYIVLAKLDANSLTVDFSSTDTSKLLNSDFKTISIPRQSFERNLVH